MAKICSKQLIDSNGIVFLDTLLDSSRCSLCIVNRINEQSYDNSEVICPIDSQRKIVGYRNINAGQVLLCGYGYGKKQLFKFDLDCISSSLSVLNQTKGEIIRFQKDEYVARVRRVLHNIRTLNAHSLQEMRALIPEYILKQHKTQSCKDVANILVGKKNETALTFFRLSKDLYQVKSEFSVYNKLINGNISLDKRCYSVRDILMLVLYPFYEDFNRKNVIVIVEDFYKNANIDFETIQIALYHIIENAAKYVKPSTDIVVEFSEENNVYCICISMQSLFIEKQEELLIFKEGYSGKQAVLAKLKGEGIGMYRAKTFIELNGGTITFSAGSDLINEGKLIYSHNSILIKIPNQ